MPYIYQIVNDINDKVYVGKTNFLLKSDSKSIVKMLSIENMKKDHYILLCENME